MQDELYPAETSETAPAIPTSPALDPLFHDGADDFLGTQPPIIKIAQGGSEDKPQGCQRGQIYNNVTGECWDDLKVILMYVSRPRRVEFQPYEKGVKKDFLCSSLDGFVPNAGIKMMPGPCCKILNGQVINVCPKLQFVDGKAPLCSTIYTALLWNLETNSPGLFTIKGTAISAYRKLANRMKAQGPSLMEAKDIPAKFLYPVMLGSKDFDTHFAPTFDWLTSADEKIPEVEARELMDHARGYIAQLGNVSTEDLVHPNKEEQSVGFGEGQEEPF